MNNIILLNNIGMYVCISKHYQKLYAIYKRVKIAMNIFSTYGIDDKKIYILHIYS